VEVEEPDPLLRVLAVLVAVALVVQRVERMVQQIQVAVAVEPTARTLQVLAVQE
jgi:hypothetical protein